MKQVKRFEAYEGMWIDKYCVRAVNYSERFRPLPDCARYYYRENRRKKGTLFAGSWRKERQGSIYVVQYKDRAQDEL